MLSRKVLFLILLIIIITSFYFIVKAPPTTEEQNAINKKEITPQTRQVTTARQDTSYKKKIKESLQARTPSSEPNLDSRITRYTDGSVDLNAAIKASTKLHKDDKKPQTDLELLSQIFLQYCYLYKENPVGVENFEFTAALTGANPKNVNFIDPESAALSSTNELVDRWNRPFIFHPLSATELEILSSGPDQTLWTDDDLKLHFEDTSKQLQLKSR